MASMPGRGASPTVRFGHVAEEIGGPAVLEPRGTTVEHHDVMARFHEHVDHVRSDKARAPRHEDPHDFVFVLCTSSLRSAPMPRRPHTPTRLTPQHPAPRAPATLEAKVSDL